MAHPIIMHINYCEQGQTIPEVCRKAVAWGYDGVEFRRTRSGVQETTEAYLDALEKGVKESGLKHVLFGYPTIEMNQPDAAERERNIREAIAFYHDVAKRLKVTTINAFTGSLKNPDPKVPYEEYEKHGSFVATEQQWDWAVKGFQALADGCSDIPIRFAFETHMAYLHDTVAAAAKLAERIGRPSVGVNLDYGNQVRFASCLSLKDAVALCGKRLYYVHLKNSVPLPKGGQLPTALSDGAINQREFVKLLLENGYDGPLCVEAPRAGDREWFAREDLAYLKSVLADLAKAPAGRSSGGSSRAAKK